MWLHGAISSFWKLRDGDLWGLPGATSGAPSDYSGMELLMLPGATSSAISGATSGAIFGATSGATSDYGKPGMETSWG